MTKTIRIGSGAGYAGDRLEPSLELIEKGNLDYISYECLAERTIAIGQQTKLKDPTKGYNGLLEEFARVGTLGAHGFTAVMLYGWFVKLFGLSYHTIVICNAVWVSLGAAAYCALIRPRPARAALLALCLMLYAPAVLYCASSMTKCSTTP